VVGKGTTFKDALKRADEVLLHATQGISDLIRVTGEVNVDFADVRTIMACRGPALMGSGFGEGENRAQEAAQEAISSPLLDDVSIKGALGVLINITGGMDLAIDEVTQVSEIIQEEAGEDAEIIFGAVHDPELEGKIRVTVIATGFDRSEAGRGTEPRVLRPDFGRPSARAAEPRRSRPQPRPAAAADPVPAGTQGGHHGGDTGGERGGCHALPPSAGAGGGPEPDRGPGHSRPSSGARWTDARRERGAGRGGVDISELRDPRQAGRGWALQPSAGRMQRRPHEL
jgi:hypothetical protein